MHYLEGIIYEGQLDGKKVLTTWSGKKDEAEAKAEAFKVQGAAKSLVLGDGKAAFRIVGYWP